MKALKEKRISLRSLWRRGLVILSLFALVFASCGDSSSSETPEETGGRRALEVNILTPPSNPQYFGQLVDLTGVTAEVKYLDGGKDVIKFDEHPELFDSQPKVVTGTFDNTGSGGFTGMPWLVVLAYDSDGKSIGYAGYSLADKDYEVIGIKRYDATTDTENPTTGAQTTETEVFAGGLHLTGKYTDAVYADATSFTFKDLKLQAEYTDGQKKDIDFDNVSWRIVPDYYRAVNGKVPEGSLKPVGDPEDGGYYRGWLEITVGEDVRSITGGNLDKNSTSTAWKGGITVRTELPKVYTVVERKGGIEWDGGAPPLKPYPFWDPNTPKYWTDKLIEADAAIIIHYTADGGKSRKTIKELSENPFIYWNLNPEPTKYDVGVTPIDPVYVAKNAPAGYKANSDPHIEVYYRGAVLPMKIDVYSVLKKFTVSYDGKDLSLNDTDQDYDNDVKLPIGTDEKKFKAGLTATATYTAYNNKDAPPVEFPLELLYGGSALNAQKRLNGPYYTSNFDEMRAAALEKFEGLSKPKEVKNTIEFYYEVDSDYVEVATGRDNLEIFGSQYHPAEKKQKAKVVWQPPES